MSSLVRSFVFVLAVHVFWRGDLLGYASSGLFARYGSFCFLAEDDAVSASPAFIGRLRRFLRRDDIGEDGLVLQGRDRRIRVGGGRQGLLRLRASEQRHASCEQQQG